MAILVCRKYYFGECPFCGCQYAFRKDEVIKEKYLVEPVDEDDNGERFKILGFCETCNKNVKMEFDGVRMYTDAAIKDFNSQMNTEIINKNNYVNLNLLEVSDDRLNEVLNSKRRKEVKINKE